MFLIQRIVGGRPIIIHIGVLLTAVSELLCSSIAVAQLYEFGYEIHGASVYDKKTHLTWARCSVGQLWKEATGCVGTIKLFTFDDAQRQGEHGWRVPTKDELATLIDHKRDSFPTIDTEVFPDMDIAHSWYWTSNDNGSSLAWDVSFGNGYINDDGDRNFAFAIRLVRKGE